MASDRPPSVDRLARALADTGLPHPLLVDAARQAVADGDPASAEARARDLAESKGALGRDFARGQGAPLRLTVEST